MGMDESLVPDQAKMILPRRMPDQRDIADAHRIIGADKIRDRKRTLDPLQTPAACSSNGLMRPAIANRFIHLFGYLRRIADRSRSLLGHRSRDFMHPQNEMV